MSDLRTTIVPKSDQLNADDLIGGRNLTIKITKVSVSAGEQPVVIHYEGDNGHPYKPGKSMRRVLIQVWGADGNDYVGRSMTLYCDDKVQFGGMAVGGIRISHMSHIDAPVTMLLTTTRSKRAPFTVKPLVVKEEAPAKPADNGPAKINREQQKLLFASMGKEVTGDQLKEKFKIESSGDILVPDFDEVLAWVADMKLTGGAN